ncbi:MAG: hypothetical protein ABIA76_03045 [Candidatus Diapherotrites archaeon]
MSVRKTQTFPANPHKAILAGTAQKTSKLARNKLYQEILQERNPAFFEYLHSEDPINRLTEKGAAFVREITKKTNKTSITKKNENGELEFEATTSTGQKIECVFYPELEIDALGRTYFPAIAIKGNALTAVPLYFFFVGEFNIASTELYNEIVKATERHRQWRKKQNENAIKEHKKWKKKLGQTK